jgi:hypothetical protein
MTIVYQTTVPEPTLEQSGSPAAPPSREEDQDRADHLDEHGRVVVVSRVVDRATGLPEARIGDQSSEDSGLTGRWMNKSKQKGRAC